LPAGSKLFLSSAPNASSIQGAPTVRNNARTFHPHGKRGPPSQISLLMSKRISQWFLCWRLRLGQTKKSDDSNLTMKNDPMIGSPFYHPIPSDFFVKVHRCHFFVIAVLFLFLLQLQCSKYESKYENLL
jgi:hypothetical protein